MSDNSHLLDDLEKLAYLSKSDLKFDEYIFLCIGKTKSELKEMIATGVKFIINSDAHYPSRVGKNHRGFNIVEKYNIPHEQVVNLDKIPRFKTYNLDVE